MQIYIAVILTGLWLLSRSPGVNDSFAKSHFPLFVHLPHGILGFWMGFHQKQLKGEIRMNHMDELIDLTQQLASVVDDMERGIISTDIYPSVGRVRHACTPEFFLQHFSTFDVKKRPGHENYPIEIRTEIDGVQFVSILSPGELHLIKDHLPESWLKPVELPLEIIHVNFEQTKNPSALACE